MTQVALVAPVAVPLVVALMVLVPRLRPAALACAPWSALPALVVAVAAPEGAMRVPWLLLDTHLALDGLGRTFLLVTAIVWLLAGVYARGYLARDPRRAGFFAFHLLAMAGNLGLILAADLASFYFFFALMSFSAYGLVIHERGEQALRAGRVYIVMAVLGDAALLAALVLIASEVTWLPLAEVPAALADSDRGGAAVPLLIAGLGVKVAVWPLHIWLPLAHPVAPTPASAVLSGAMIKAGLLGWLRLLPLGHQDLFAWGAWAMAGGMAATFYGVVVGLPQRDPKTVLAYSSMSQMGLMTAAAGVAMAAPAHAPTAVAAAALHAVHHGLAKASLFLSVGIVRARLAQRWRAVVVAGVALPVLAMAAAPLTSGAVTKKALEGAFAHAPGGFGAALGALLPVTSTATLLLLLRFGQLVRAEAGKGTTPPARSMVLGWGASVLAAASALWLLPWAGAPDHAARSLGVGPWLSSVWPLALGAAIAFLALRVRWRMRAGAIPPGDVVVVAERVAGHLARAARAVSQVRARLFSVDRPQRWAHRTLRRLLAVQGTFGGWTVGATWLLFVAILLFALLWIG
jgi:formate hydrogenlyase subunit 3/multisubunit Na+/H+ antiporter MnhD subunit